MKPKTLLVFAVLALIVGFVISALAHAGFIDDWIQQKTESSPGYFAGQQRGYVSGGSFSARWPMKNDHLISFEPPRLKVGCGGIDAFMGGFSFLNFDYLVQKLQKILQAAPAAAFELALKDLCEQCTEVMNVMNDMSDFLNSLQLNDCQASKVLAAKVMTGFTDNPKIEAESQKNFILGEGIGDLYDKINNDITSQNGGSQVPNESAMFSGCPQELQDIFLTPGESILQAVGEKKGYPAQYITMMRGLIGDINLQQTTDANGNITIDPTMVDPCAANSSASALDLIYNNEFFLKPYGSDDESACTQTTDVGLTAWTQTQLSSIYSKMQRKVDAALTDDEYSFINVIPANIYLALKAAAITNQGDYVLGELTEIAARGYANELMKDFLGGLRHSLIVARSVLANKGRSPQNTCQVDMLWGFEPEIARLEKRTDALISIIGKDFEENEQQHATLLGISARYQDFNNLAKDKLSKSFTQALTARVLGGM